MEHEVNMEEQVDDDIDEANYNEPTDASFQAEETSSNRSKNRKNMSQDKSFTVV